MLSHWWGWVFTSWGSLNSRFLNFTQQFTGCEEGKLGNLSSGDALSDENCLGTPFFFPHGMGLVNVDLDSWRRWERGLEGWEHKGCEDIFGKSGTLSVSSQLGYLWARDSSVDNPHCLSRGAKGNVWPVILGGTSQCGLWVHILRGVFRRNVEATKECNTIKFPMLSNFPGAS